MLHVNRREFEKECRKIYRTFVIVDALWIGYFLVIGYTKANTIMFTFIDEPRFFVWDSEKPFRLLKDEIGR